MRKRGRVGACAPPPAGYIFKRGMNASQEWSVRVEALTGSPVFLTLLSVAQRSA